MNQQSSHINKMDAVLRARSAVETEKMNKVRAEQDIKQ